MPDMKLLRRGSGKVAIYILDHRGFADMCAGDAAVISVAVEDWNRDMSPWPAERCFKNGEDFGGGAGEYIAELIRAIPEFEKTHGLTPEHRAICGYSLAGLCALYALYVSDMFDGAVSASGSMWFDGWLEFMETHAPACGHAKVYLSVGDKEARTRNVRLAAVEESTRRACEILTDGGHEAVFRLNPGNHFNEPEKRVAIGIDTLYNMYMKI